jgi:hypothetical protein
MVFDPRIGKGKGSQVLAPAETPKPSAKTATFQSQTDQFALDSGHRRKAVLTAGQVDSLLPDHLAFTELSDEIALYEAKLKNAKVQEHQPYLPMLQQLNAIQSRPRVQPAGVSDLPMLFSFRDMMQLTEESWDEPMARPGLMEDIELTLDVKEAQLEQAYDHYKAAVKQSLAAGDLWAAEGARDMLEVIKSGLKFVESERVKLGIHREKYDIKDFS